MTWEDTKLDAVAALEEMEPKEVKEKIAAYLGGKEDDWYPEWKNYLLGILLWNHVVESPFPKYVDEVFKLRDLIKERSDELLKAYEAGESWNANDAQKEIASFLHEFELKHLRAGKKGKSVKPRRLKFQPTSRRVWKWGEVSATKVDKLHDTLRVKIEMINDETGDIEAHEIDYVFNGREVSKMFGEHGTGNGRYLDFKDIPFWNLKEVREPVKTGEMGDSFMTVVLKVGFTFYHEGEGGYNNFETKVLRRTIYMKPSTGTVDHDSYWEMFETHEL